MEQGQPNIAVFAATVLELARADPRVLVVTSDSRGSGGLETFARELPQQLVEVGIAEQNLVGLAAGLAAGGNRVFAVSPASFLTARALEQIKNDVAYSDHPVVLVGISAGVSYGPLGATHHATHDLAVLRAIPNITVVAPADNLETRQATLAAASAPHPVYLRLGKRPMPNLHPAATPFRLGQAITLGSGRDVVFVACGEVVAEAVLASELLRAEGIAVGVLSMHTVKPLDEVALLQAARVARAVITVEEHSRYGGLGEACAACLLERGICVPFRLLGLPDEPTHAGSQTQVLAHYALDAAGLARTARECLPSQRSAEGTA